MQFYHVIHFGHSSVLYLFQAFDKKTSVMQYLVRLLLQQDPNVLEFHKDLVNLREASLFSISSLHGEINNMNQNISSGKPFLESDIEPFIVNFEGDFNRMKSALTDIDVIPYSTFIQRADKLVSALETEVCNVDKQYKDLLSYVGEDPDLSSENFFGTLHQFCDEVESTVTQV